MGHAPPKVSARGRVWERAVRDPQEGAPEHAATAYVEGRIDYDEFERRVHLAVFEPNSYVNRYCVPAPPPPANRR